MLDKSETKVYTIGTVRDTAVPKMKITEVNRMTLKELVLSGYEPFDTYRILTDSADYIPLTEKLYLQYADTEIVRWGVSGDDTAPDGARILVDLEV